MQVIDPGNVADYLRATGRASATQRIQACELVGGVSNAVILVTVSNGREQVEHRFVVKQARERLRVKEQWLCPPQRIWREVDCLSICGQLLGRESATLPITFAVPILLWEDRPNYLYAMTAAPLGHQTWKQRLLAGIESTDVLIAKACGELLATLHGNSWSDAAVAHQLSDQAYFEQLRLDPYYRQVARVHRDLKGPIDGLLNSLAENRLSLVHGDFSPKNLLIWRQNALLIDFEVGHFGDPAFDLGFFLTHLVLKAIWAADEGARYRALAADFWGSYELRMRPTITEGERTRLERRALLNLAGCILARIDGKSPVDYLSPAARDKARKLGRHWLLDPPKEFTAALNQLSIV